MVAKAFISVEFDRRSLKELKDTINEIPDAIRRGLGESSQLLATSMRATAPFWRGKLKSSIKVEEVGNDNFHIKMYKYGAYLNKMTPHTVALKPGRKITKWASEHGFHTGTKTMYIKADKSRGWLDHSLINAPQIVKDNIDSNLGDI